MKNSISVKRNNDLYTSTTKNKGLGIFCKTSIKAGETIETTPCILFSASEATDIDKTNLFNYYFSANFLTDEEANALNITDKDKAGIIACGVMGFCNHANSSNGEIMKFVHNGRIFFKLQASKDIQAHEEITVSYGETWFDVLS